MRLGFVGFLFDQTREVALCPSDHQRSIHGLAVRWGSQTNKIFEQLLTVNNVNSVLLVSNSLYLFIVLGKRRREIMQVGIQTQDILALRVTNRNCKWNSKFIFC